jgi:outer membrane protein assembly factor BamB
MHTDLKTHPIILGTLLLIFLTAPVSGTVITSPGTADLTITSSDWPWWRGIHRNGHAAEQSIPTQWSETESIIWKAPIPGRGHGSPTVIGEQIFLATADEQNQTQSVIGFDRKTGERAWITEVHKGGWQGRIHDRNTQASSSIASDGEKLFVAFMHDAKIWLSALDLTGKLLWQKKASDYTSHWGYSSSPAIYENLVIVASDHKEGGNLTAFDRNTSEQVWNVSRPAIPNYASPVIYHLNGQDQLILPGCDMLASYHPRSGRLLWSAPVTTQETVGSAVTDGTRIFASGGYPKNETTSVLVDNTPELDWRNPIRTYAPSMLVDGGYLYTMTDKGLAHCWDTETGKLMWREKVGGDFSASPVLVGNNIFVSSEQGKTLVFKASPEKFELIAENQLGNEIWATPVICGDSIYLRVAHHETGGRQEYLYRIGD